MAPSVLETFNFYSDVAETCSAEDTTLWLAARTEKEDTATSSNKASLPVCVSVVVRVWSQ